MKRRAGSYTRVVLSLSMVAGSSTFFGVEMVLGQEGGKAAAPTGLVAVSGSRYCVAADNSSAGDIGSEAGVVSPQATMKRGQPSPATGLELLGRLPLAFVQNRGQLDERALFTVRRGGMAAFFTRNSLILQLVRREKKREKEDSPRHGPPLTNERSHDEVVAGASVFLTFEGASDQVEVEGADELPGRYNYFLGNQPSKWRTDTPAYASIRYRGLYPGLDLVVREQEGRLEYDLLLEPGVDLDQLVIRCEGAEYLRLDEGGSLVIATAIGPIEQPRPDTYEVGADGVPRRVACAYRLLGPERFGFDVPERDPASSIVIDPGLVYGTFLGGSDLDYAISLALDASGAVLVTGDTSSSDFPTTPGVYDTASNGRQDVFVAMLSADGSGLLYGTFLGGQKDDFCLDIAVDATGQTVVTGKTLSADFPTTAGAYDTTENGYWDAWVAKLSAHGSQLLYGTFLGGSEFDQGLAIAVDQSDAVLVTGQTVSSGFPTTPGAFDPVFNGRLDVFVAKLSADGSQLLYGTFLGGSFDDGVWGLGVEASGAALVAGWTCCSDFPTTPGAYDTTYNGLTTYSDAFVAKLSADGSQLLYGTFLGGSDQDGCDDLVVDASGAALVTGETHSSDFPATPGAFDTTRNAGDAFVAKLSPDGSRLLYATFLGGSNNDYGDKIVVDAAGAALVTGHTSSSDFPATPGAFDTTRNGGDAFVAKLSADGSQLLYATFLGGQGDEWGYGIGVDASGAAFVAGQTSSSDFPTTPGALDTSFNGVKDAFVAKLMPCAGGTWTNYGSGWPGTNGIPALTASGPPALCTQITISVGNSCGAATVALCIIGFNRASVPTVLGGTLLVVPSFFVNLSLPAAGANLSYAIVCDDEFCGFTVDLQVLEVDPGASQGVSFTSGLGVVYGS